MTRGELEVDRDADFALRAGPSLDIVLTFDGEIAPPSIAYAHQCDATDAKYAPNNAGAAPRATVAGGEYLHPPAFRAPTAPDPFAHPYLAQFPSIPTNQPDLQIYRNQPSSSQRTTQEQCTWPVAPQGEHLLYDGRVGHTFPSGNGPTGTLSGGNYEAFAYTPPFIIPSSQALAMSEFSDSSGIATSQSSSTPSPRLIDASALPNRASFDTSENPLGGYRHGDFTSSDQDLPGGHHSPALSASPDLHEYGHNGLRQGRDSQSLPFEATEQDRRITANGTLLNVDVHTSISKNVFFVDNTWTCYRRNYISAECSYTLQNCSQGAPLYLSPHDQDGSEVSKVTRIQALAMSISATADAKDGKLVELVQHTPKRDKGPQSKIKFKNMMPSPATLPRPFGSATGPRPDLPLQTIQADEDGHSYGSLPSSEHSTYTFERVQFKNATANNGRRRAQQQHYLISIGLYADVRAPHESHPTWVRIARRVSEPLVVRGRSPGHYSDGRAETNGNNDTGAGGGAGNHGNYASGYGGGASGAQNHGAMPGNSFGNGIPLGHRYFGHWRDRRVLHARTSDNFSPNVSYDSNGHDDYLYFPQPMHDQQEYRRRPAMVKTDPSNESPTQYVASPHSATMTFSAGACPSASWHPGCGLPGFATSRGHYPDVY